MGRDGGNAVVLWKCAPFAFCAAGRYSEQDHESH